MSGTRSPLLSDILDYCAKQQKPIHAIELFEIFRIFQSIKRDELNERARAIMDEDYNDLLSHAQKVRSKLPLTDKNMAKILTELLPTMAKIAYRIYLALNDPDDCSWKDSIPADQLADIVTVLCKGYTFIIPKKLCDASLRENKHGVLEIDNDFLGLAKLLTYIGKDTFEDLLQYAKAMRGDTTAPQPTAADFIAKLNAEAELDPKLKNALGNITPRATPRTTPRTTPQPSPRGFLEKSSSTPAITHNHTISSMTSALVNGLKNQESFHETNKIQLIAEILTFITKVKDTPQPNTKKGELLTQMATLISLVQANPSDEILHHLLAPIADVIKIFTNELALFFSQETLSLDDQQEIHFLNLCLLNAVLGLNKLGDPLLADKNISTIDTLGKITAMGKEIKTGERFAALTANSQRFKFNFSQSESTISKTGPRNELTVAAASLRK